MTSFNYGESGGTRNGTRNKNSDNTGRFIEEDHRREASSRAETWTSTTTAAEAASVIVCCFFSVYLSFMVRVLCFTCGLYLPAHECP